MDLIKALEIRKIELEKVTAEVKRLREERDELKAKLSEPTVGMVMSYEAGLADRDYWKRRAEAADKYLSSKSIEEADENYKIYQSIKQEGGHGTV